MKKKLEAELISIAHRILKLSSKSDLAQLHAEARNVYEKLSILKFAEENLGDIKPTIGISDVEDKLADFDQATQKTQDFGEAADKVSEAEVEITHEENPDEDLQAAEIEEPETEEPEVETEPERNIEKFEDAEEIPPAEDAGVSFSAEDAPKKEDLKPSFELSFEDEPKAKTEEAEVKSEEPKVDEPITAEPEKEKKQIAFEDFLGNDYNEPVFVKAGEDKKPEEKQTEATIPVEAENVSEEPKAKSEEPKAKSEEPVEKPKSDNTVSSSEHKTITVALNDRIGFEKQLFGGSGEDLNRVLSQLNTFDTLQEAQDFIEDMVKPDYNNWEGKDDYAQRFMDLVEKKFN